MASGRPLQNLMGTIAYPDRSSLEAEQLSKLRTLISALVPGNRFYSSKIREAGLTPEIPTLSDFLRQMPFTVKSELVEDQLAHPPYGTNLTFPLQRYTRLNQTSATTGTPLRWLDTSESWEGMLDNWEEVYRAAQVKRSDRILFAFSFGPFLGFWTAFESALRRGCFCIPGGGLSSQARLQAIVENDVNVLCCTPTYAIRLAEVAAEEQIELEKSSIQTIITAGEPGGSIASTRSLMETLWNGARIVDHHGMTEVGPVSYECPRRPGVLHVIESAYIAEVIDPDTGRPLEPGNLGELVLTTLSRIASPLLRYRTGDVVKASLAVPCECGRSDLALEGGIVGRTDDMVVIKGVNLFPSLFEEVARAVKGVAEYRVEIRRDTTLPEARMQVEPSPEVVDEGELARELESRLRSVTTLRIPVSVVPRGTLPRFEMKAKRWKLC